MAHANFRCHGEHDIIQNENFRDAVEWQQMLEDNFDYSYIHVYLHINLFSQCFVQ